MSDLPENVKPVVALKDGVDLDGYYQLPAAVSDEFAPGATQGDQEATS